MITKKQIVIPVVTLLIGIAAMVAFTSLKKPPEEKADVDNIPRVTVAEVNIAPMVFTVESYGMVKPKYETEIIAQVLGEIVELSPAFVRGGFVKKNQLLARIDPNDYEAALIDAQAAMATARAALEQEVAQGKVAEQEWNQITDTSPTELSLRKPQLAQELARVKAAQASVLRAERNLERTQIRAPYDAVIDGRNIGLGSFVGIGTKIGHVMATGTAEIRLPVADNQLQYLVEQGVGAKVNLVASYAGKETQWQARVMRNEGVIDSKSRMGYLVTELKDPYQLNLDNKAHVPLRFGSYVNAKIMGKNIPQATTIPRHLVNNKRVAILSDNHTLRYVPITIARQQEGSVIVTHGLTQGDRLVTSALDYPVDGMKLALAIDQANMITDKKDMSIDVDEEASLDESTVEAGE